MLARSLWSLCWLGSTCLGLAESFSEADCEEDGAAYIQVAAAKATAPSTAALAPAERCTVGLGQTARSMRQRMDDVFFELYGAKMVRDGMQKFEYRPHWPDMSEEGSRQRVEKLSAFKVELESASKTPQLLGDKNALSRMLYLVEERLRGEGIGGGALPVALAMDLFNQGRGGRNLVTMDSQVASGILRPGEKDLPSKSKA